ncbi:MAG: DUF6443 domain-containing protein, partial [Bacteroidota bacterium]
MSKTKSIRIKLLFLSLFLMAMGANAQYQIIGDATVTEDVAESYNILDSFGNTPNDLQNIIWTITGIHPFGIQGNGTTQITVTFTSPGFKTIDFYGEKAGSGEQITVSRTITVNAASVGQVSTPSGISSRCQGSGTTDYNASAINASSYSWSLTPSSAGSINASTGLVSWSSNYHGTAQVSVTAYGPNSSSSYATRNITVIVLPQAPPLNRDGGPDFCFGSVVRLYTPPAAGPGLDYTLYNENGTSFGTKQASSTNAVLEWNVTESGSYHIEAINPGDSCGSDIGTATTVSIRNQTGTPAMGDITVCGAQVLDLTPSGISGATYNWYNGSGNLITSGTTYSTLVSYSQDFQVSATVDGCEGPRNTFSVTIKTKPNKPTLVQVESPTCSDPTGKFRISNHNGSYNYEINGPAGAQRNGDLVTGSPGTYTLRAVLDGCYSDLSDSITVDPVPIAPTAPALSLITHPSCANSIGSFAITNFNGDPNSYSVQPGSGISISSTGVISAPSGNYTVSVTLDGCTSGDSEAMSLDTAPSSVIWYLDGDNDGYYTQTQTSCTSPGTGWTDDATSLQPGDCDDSTYSPTNDCSTVVSNDPEDHNYIYTRNYQKEGYGESNVPGFFTTDDDLLQQITYYDGLGRPMQQNGIRQSPDGKDIVTHMGYDDYGRMDREWLPITDKNQSTDYGHFTTGDMEAATKAYYKNHTMYFDDFTGLTEPDANPYSQKHFEPSPLNRVLKQAAPGEAWKLNTSGEDHSIGFGYLTNTHDPLDPGDADNDNVRLFRVNTVFADNTYTPTLVYGDYGNGDPVGYYAQGELYKNITRDENHSGDSKLHTTEEFTDKQGRVVLKRTFATVTKSDGTVSVAEPHDTYYVYDDYGNLTYVLPPKMEAGTTSLADLNDRMAQLGYQYVYDHRNRLVEKQLPGKGWEYIVYNKLDQPIMTQDANQREKSPKEWLFTKYDVLGRVAYTGKALDNGSRTDIQGYADTVANDPAQELWVETGSFSNGGIDIGYGNTAYPTSTVSEVLTVNYYDDYGFDLANEPTPPTTVFGTALDDRTQGLPTGAKVRVLDPSASSGQADWITTVTRYDAKARPIYTYSENTYLGTVDIVGSQLDFMGRPLKVRRSHTRSLSGAEGTIVTLDSFAYDHTGRLLTQTQCIGDETLGENCPTGDTAPATIVWDGTTDGDITEDVEATESITVTKVTILPGDDGVTTLRIVGGSGQELIVHNAYDELGQLVQKKVGGAPGTDYDGTDGLQTVDYAYNVRGWLKSINNVGNTDKLFNFRIGYNDSAHGAVPLYNGNISETTWRTAHVEDSSLKYYTYGYDALNRITSATDNTGYFNLGSDTRPITYDKNGNIQKLLRLGHVEAMPDLSDNATDDSDYGTMDDLAYSYHNFGHSNRLYKVNDSGNDSYGFTEGSGLSQDYWYDANGNMVRDLNKGIGNASTDGITYNHLNLPVSVTIDDGSNDGTITYIYDATGVKLEKTALGTDANGPVNTVTQYAGNYIYENGALQFFNHPEGYVNANGGGYEYVYQYKDHLGNVRLSYTDDPSNPGTPTIIEENNYYPFGLEHKGYNNQINGVENNYMTYNGKELEESLGLNWLDYGARNYMPDIGRWTSMDPLTEKYYDKSSYNYSLNNPIFFVDPDGQEVDVTELLRKGGKNETFLLINLMANLSEISGQKISINTDNDGKSTLMSEGCGDGGNCSDKGSALVDHLLGSEERIAVYSTSSGTATTRKGG